MAQTQAAAARPQRWGSRTTNSPRPPTDAELAKVLAIPEVAVAQLDSMGRANYEPAGWKGHLPSQLTPRRRSPTPCVAYCKVVRCILQGRRPGRSEGCLRGVSSPVRQVRRVVRHVRHPSNPERIREIRALTKPLRAQMSNALLATGRFVGIYPGSLVRLGAKRLAIKVLPIDLPILSTPVGIVATRATPLQPGSQRPWCKPLMATHRAPYRRTRADSAAAHLRARPHVRPAEPRQDDTGRAALRPAE
jgi:hypothetical protein